MLFSLPAAATAQRFVYPVGDDPSERPLECGELGNENGYCITRGFKILAHTGVDLAKDREPGGEVRAIGPGTVSKTNTCQELRGACNDLNPSGWGNAVLIRHILPDGTFYSLYAHLQDGSVKVGVDDPVKAGTAIGNVGSTGLSTAPHLHFAVKRQDSFRCGYIRGTCADESFDNFLDPLDFIAERRGEGRLVNYPIGAEGGALDVLQNPDGSYIAAGWTKAFPILTSDMWVAKLDSSLQRILWQNTYAGFSREEVSRIERTSDGGYIAIGLSTSFGAPHHEPIVLKLDQDGNLEAGWPKRYRSSGRDWGGAITQTADGGYVFAGFTDPPPFGGVQDQAAVLKLFQNGEIDWELSLAAPSASLGSIQQTDDDGDGVRDDGFIVAGITTRAGAGAEDIFLLKLDAKGNPQWQKTYGGSAGDTPGDVQVTADGGYVIAGSTASFGAEGSDAWVLKLDANGEIACPACWQNRYGGPGHQAASRIQQTSDGGFIVSGRINSPESAGPDVWVFRLDSNGGLIWDRRYDNGTPEEHGFGIRETNDGGYIVAGGGDPGCPTGCTSSPSGDQFFLIKLRPDGRVSDACPPGIGDLTNVTVQDTTNEVLVTKPTFPRGHNSFTAADAVGLSVTGTAVSAEPVCPTE